MCRLFQFVKQLDFIKNFVPKEKQLQSVMLYHYQRRMENPGDATHVPLTLGGKAGSA
jgi:hypothetical protein